MIAQEQFAAKAQHVYSQVDSLLNLIRSSINDMTPDWEDTGRLGEFGSVGGPSALRGADWRHPA